MRCVFYTISFHLNFSLLMFLLWDSKGWQFRNNFLSKYSVPYDTIYNMQNISFEKNVYIYMNDSREGRTRRRMWYVQYSRCIFWTYFFIAAPIFYISILKLYHRWYDIVSIILLYVCTYTCIQCFGPNHALQVNRNHYNPQIF